jgi:release factor glutamine methyltransferase
MLSMSMAETVLSTEEFTFSKRRKFIRFFFKAYLYIRFQVLQKHRYTQLTLETIDDMSMVVLPQVFNPKLLRTGEFLAIYLNSTLINQQSKVLDMGTGSGVGAVFSAKFSDNVTAIDINPDAVRCATINALLNKQNNKISVLEGNLFEPLEKDETFDLILFNPPYYYGKPKDKLDHAWRGDQVVEVFIQQLKQRLTDKGLALLVLSSDGEIEDFFSLFKKYQLKATIVAKKDLINEIIFIVQLSYRQHF